MFSLIDCIVASALAICNCLDLKYMGYMRIDPQIKPPDTFGRSTTIECTVLQKLGEES